MIQKRIAAAITVAAIAFSQANAATTTASTNAAPAIPSRAAIRAAKQSGVASFDMASYLAELSAEGRERGYKEFVYKQTPQGELRIYFATPADWSPNDRRPVMIFFFGGGWSGGRVFACVREAEHFAKRGVVVGLADYRVRNRQGVMPDKCAEDARSAVRWVRANCAKLGVDPERVIAGGGSAGGHIAACTAIPGAPNSDTDDRRVSCIPNALLLYYPVASLVDGSRANAFKRLLGEELALKLSPARHATKSWPPTVMFSGTADIELANGILLHNKAEEAGVNFELYLAEGRGHGVARTAPRDFGWLQYAADFFMRAGVIDKGPSPDALPGNLLKYNGGPVEKIFIKPEGNPPDGEPPTLVGKRGAYLEPTLGKKGRLLLEETFDGDILPKGWNGKTGGLRVADGTLHASQKAENGRLCLFSREQPMQDAAIQIDFNFNGAQGLNISCNPSPGELQKHGHMFSVMITRAMWNITEHNDKADRTSRSQALASARATFERGRWYTLLLECKGGEVVARIEGKEPLRASSKDFSVKKPGIEFRVAGRAGGEVIFDNLRVWELK